jgi:hypothetical protein
MSPLQKGISHREEATLAAHCVWCSAGEITKILKKKFKDLKIFRNFVEYLRALRFLRVANELSVTKIS